MGLNLVEWRQNQPGTDRRGDVGAAVDAVDARLSAEDDRQYRRQSNGRESARATVHVGIPRRLDTSELSGAAAAALAMAAAELPGPPFPSRPEPSALKAAPKPKPPPLPGAPHFGQVVIGPPGAGKTTYCWGVQQFLQACGR